MKTTIAWDTGRGYNNGKHRIAAMLEERGSILFVDVDRGINGRIPDLGFTKQEMLDYALFDEAAVLGQYDNGNYMLADPWDMLSEEGTMESLAALANNL